MQDTTLQSIARLSRTYGPAAQRELRRRVDGLERDTATLTNLTAELNAPVAGIQQLEASPEDHALDQLREMFG